MGGKLLVDLCALGVSHGLGSGGSLLGLGGPVLLGLDLSLGLEGGDDLRLGPADA